LDNKENNDENKIDLSLEKGDLDEKIEELSDEKDKIQITENKVELVDDKKKKDKPKATFRFLILFFIFLGLFTVLLFAIGQEPTWTIQYLYYKYYWYYNVIISLIILIFLLIGIRKLGILKNMILFPLFLITFLVFSVPLIYFMTDWSFLITNPINYLKQYRFDFAFLNFFPVVLCLIVVFIGAIVFQTIRWINKKAIIKLIALYLPIILIIGASIYFLKINPFWKDNGNVIQTGAAGLKDDLDYILLNEKKYNLDFRAQEDQASLEKKINDLKGKVSEEPFENLLVDLKRLNATYIDQNNDISYAGKGFPFILYAFSDGYYVIQNSKPYDNTYGRRLVAVNGVKVEDLEKQFLGITSFGSQSRLKSIYATYLTDYTILKGLNIINSEECNFTFNNGSSDFNVTASALDQRELSKQMQNNNYEIEKTFVYMQNKVLLAKDNNVLRYVYQNYDSSANFDNVKILDYLNTKTVRTFFIDLRNSSDGNTRYFTKLANAIKYRKIKPSNVVCATNRDTILSGVVAAQNIKEILEGTSIGEDTGGSISNCTNNEAFITPNNNINFNIIVKDNKVKGKSPILVDKIINIESKDYFNRIDPVYEYVKTL